jgi:DNA-binding response OmpR family regulator
MTKILAVDNDSDTVMLTKIIFKSRGYAVLAANSGEECLKKIMTEKPDLVLLDIMMSDMSGWDIYEKIKKLKGKKPKVAFLTALSASSERIAELKREGIADYITKPFAANDLVNRVKAILKDDSR